MDFTSIIHQVSIKIPLEYLLALPSVEAGPDTRSKGLFRGRKQTGPSHQDMHSPVISLEIQRINEHTKPSCSEPGQELLFDARQTKLAEACRPNSHGNGGFVSVLPQLWGPSSDRGSQSFETSPGVSEKSRVPSTHGQGPPKATRAGRGRGSAKPGGLTPISPHQLPPQKPFMAVPEAVCPPEPRLCTTSPNKITVPCYSE